MSRQGQNRGPRPPSGPAVLCLPFGVDPKSGEKNMEEKSRSELKRRMQGLQKLGERLVGLPSSLLEKIEMPEELRQAVLHARSLKKHEARRRELQHVGVIMRKVDPEPIREALEEFARGRKGEAARFQQVERWRDRIVDGDEEILQEILDRFPGADRQKLAQLARNARKEREAKKPPACSRALFRYLTEISKEPFWG